MFRCFFEPAQPRLKNRFLGAPSLHSSRRRERLTSRNLIILCRAFAGTIAYYLHVHARRETAVEKRNEPRLDTRFVAPVEK